MSVTIQKFPESGELPPAIPGARVRVATPAPPADEGSTRGDLARESLAMHCAGRPGKIEIVATKPLTTQRDLSLAYSPAWPRPACASPRIPSWPTTTRSKAIWSRSSPTARRSSASAISAPWRRSR